MDENAERAKRILRSLRESGSLMDGAFTLRSGETSSRYIDCRKALLNPETAPVIAEELVKELRGRDLLHAGGVAHGGIPMTAHAVLHSAATEGPAISGFYCREARKEHGAGALLEGNVPAPGTRVAILDDVVTTGESMLRAAQAAGEAGLSVELLLAVADRDQGGTQRLERAGYRFRALTKIGQD